MILVRVKKALAGAASLTGLEKHLPLALASTFTDFKAIGSGTTRTLAGSGYVFTFERTKAGLVQSEIVIPTAAATYEIDVALPAGANADARQVGSIVRSFDD